MYCMKCGAENEEYAVFCGFCGKRLQSIPQRQSSTLNYNRMQNRTQTPTSTAAIISFAIGVFALVVTLLSIAGNAMGDTTAPEGIIEFLINGFMFLMSGTAVSIGFLADTKNKKGTAYEVMGIVFGIIGAAFFGVRLLWIIETLIQKLR